MLLHLQTEGALYWTVMTLHIHPYSMWKDTKVELLKRLLVLAQARYQSATGQPRLVIKESQANVLYTRCAVCLQRLICDA